MILLVATNSDPVMTLQVGLWQEEEKDVLVLAGDRGLRIMAIVFKFIERRRRFRSKIFARRPMNLKIERGAYGPYRIPATVDEFGGVLGGVWAVWIRDIFL
ncbi:hypothetical protein OIU78_006944 [Salix suchowensis]|nr:hypothetical protein OIU78_006944 [Salix suchowensis]